MDSKSKVLEYIKKVLVAKMELFFVIFLQIFCLYQLFLTSFLLYRNIKNNKHKLLTFYRDTKEVIVVQYRLAKNRRTKNIKTQNRSITIAFHRTIVKKEFRIFLFRIFLQQQIYKQWRKFVPYLSTPSTQ